MAKTTAKDDQGIEFIVETGYGNVTKVEPPKAGGRNAKVHFSADGLKIPVTGWADSTNPDVWEPVQAAASSGGRVSFRVEIHRDAKVAKDLPMAQVGQTDRFRRLVEVKPAAAAGHGTPTAAPQSEDGDPGPQDPNDYGAPIGRSGSRVAEGKPWEAHNSDGSPNLGSYAFLAALGTVEWAYELVTKRMAEKGSQGDPDPAKVKALAAMLLDAADAAQASVRHDGHVDRMDGSHTRARGAVRSIVDAAGVPWDSFSRPDGRRAWVDALATKAAGLLSMALDLNERPARASAA